MRIWSATLVWLPLALGCGRTDEPPAPRTAGIVQVPSAPRSDALPHANASPHSVAAPTVDSAPSESTGAAQRCVVPWTNTPAPRARPATICPEPSIAPPTLRYGSVVFQDAPNRPRVDVELAMTAEQRSTGLMYRTSLAPDAGMLFSWTYQEVRSFWMHNTCLALDMLFIGTDGTVSGILEQVPPLNDLPRSVPCKVQHVLEVNAGWSRAHGVAPGQHVAFED